MLWGYWVENRVSPNMLTYLAVAYPLQSKTVLYTVRFRECSTVSCQTVNSQSVQWHVNSTAHTLLESKRKETERNKIKVGLDYYWHKCTNFAVMHFIGLPGYHNPWLRMCAEGYRRYDTGRPRIA